VVPAPAGSGAERGDAVARNWLFKSDPETFGIRELEESPQSTTMWDGVRNYQARNHLRDDLRIGDRVLYYHSRCKPPGVVGTARVARGPYADPTQFDSTSSGCDPKSDPSNPRWYAVDICLETRFDRPVTLAEIRGTVGLEPMVLLQSSRLSIQPVTSEEWRIIIGLSKSRSPR